MSNKIPGNSLRIKTEKKFLKNRGFKPTGDLSSYKKEEVLENGHKECTTVTLDPLSDNFTIVVSVFCDGLGLSRSEISYEDGETTECLSQTEYDEEQREKKQEFFKIVDGVLDLESVKTWVYEAGKLKETEKVSKEKFGSDEVEETEIEIFNQDGQVEATTLFRTKNGNFDYRSDKLYRYITPRCADKRTVEEVRKYKDGTEEVIYKERDDYARLIEKRSSSLRSGKIFAKNDCFITYHGDSFIKKHQKSIILQQCVQTTIEENFNEKGRVIKKSSNSEVVHTGVFKKRPGLLSQSFERLHKGLSKPTED